MRLPFIVAVTAMIVVMGVALYVTNFTAYLGNNPATCNNCHVMDAVYESWFHGDHQAWAVCSDCHTPHALIPKYIVKAESGFRHVSAFALGHIPAAIRARASSLEVIQENCVRCHAETVADIAASQMDAGRYCFDCHRSTAHGGLGISLSPYPYQENPR